MGRTETNIQNRIMSGCSDIALLARIPAGQYYAGKLQDGIVTNPRPVRVAFTGYPDLSGHRLSDGRAVYIEVKTDTGRVRPEQERFITVAKQNGCLAGVARSVAEAREIIQGDQA